MRRLAVLAVAVLALVGALGGVAPDGSASGSDPTMVEVGDDRIWPYVGPDPSFARPASSVNVVVHADPASVRRYLAREAEWNRTAGERVDVPATAPVDAEAVPWRDAPGAPRYTFVAGEGWLAERYQLHRGAYFGSRDHLRVYGPRDGDWTAMQAHAEHWDWFTVTHTVDSVETAQRGVEAAFLGEPGFEVRRRHYANGDTYDADGWTTVVVVALVPLLAGRRLRRVATARNARRLALAGALAALVLVVRAGGVLFERHLAWLTPDAVVALWYPVLVVGVPVAAALLGRRLPPGEAAAFAGLGFGGGVVLDYAYLGVGVLPIPVAAHRALAVVAVALVAAGAGQVGESRGMLRAGIVAWVVVVLVGHLV